MILSYGFCYVQNIDVLFSAKTDINKEYFIARKDENIYNYNSV